MTLNTEKLEKYISILEEFEQSCTENGVVRNIIKYELEPSLRRAAEHAIIYSHQWICMSNINYVCSQCGRVAYNHGRGLALMWSAFSLCPSWKLRNLLK